MTKPIRNGKLEIIGYSETGTGNRETLRDKSGRILGRLNPTPALHAMSAAKSQVAAQTNCCGC